MLMEPVTTDFIESRLRAGNPGFITVVAMVETVCVLELAKRVTGPSLASVIESILQTDAFQVEHEREVSQP